MDHSSFHLIASWTLREGRCRPERKGLNGFLLVCHLFSQVAFADAVRRLRHYGLRGGVRNFFYVWCEQTLISHLSGYPKPRSKECPLLGPLLGPPGPKIDQKRVQIAQKRPKSDFEGSGGPKRLERRGTRYGTYMLGFSDQLGVRGWPQFWPRGAQKGPKWPKNGQNLT